MQYTTERIRDCVDTVVRMKRRALKNGIVIHYTFEHLFRMPHFEYFSDYISGTGYRSDFFGSYGQELSEAEVLEAFDIRANIFYEKRQEELRKSPDFKRNRASQPGQLVLALDS